MRKARKLENREKKPKGQSAWTGRKEDMRYYVNSNKTGRQRDMSLWELSSPKDCPTI